MNESLPSHSVYPFITGIHWRDTAKPLRFFILDARVLAPFLIWACHMCVESFICALLGIVFFIGLECACIPLDAFFRMLKRAPFGPKRPCTPAYSSFRRVLC